MKLSRKSLILLSLAALVPGEVLARPEAAAPVEMIEQVVVPVPREVFAALDNLGEVNWGVLVRKPDYKLEGDRTATALLFGVVIADGFVAVQAKDTEATKRLGPAVLELAELLGVKSAVTKHAKAIVDGAEQGKWAEVRSELDRTQATVRQTMAELRDEDLAQFVSMGGWLRGTEAAGAAVLGNFSPDTADLLHQPGLVAHFRKVLKQLDGGTAKQPALLRIKKDLPRLEALMKRKVLDEKGVREVRDLCAGMIVEVLGKSQKGGE